MCNHLNLNILIHIFTIIYLIMIRIMRGENFVAHLDGLGGTPVCRGTPVAHHWVNLYTVSICWQGRDSSSLRKTNILHVYRDNFS
jgi:hypothetical protein